MKKLFALLLVLCLLCCSAAMAEGAEANWADVEAAANEIGGGFVSIEDLSLVMWLPDGYVVNTDLSEEYTSVGYFAIFAPEDGSGAVALQYVESDGSDLLERVNNIEGAANAETMTVNGLPCVNFDMPESNASCLAFATEKGNVFVITCAPITSEDFAKKATIIIASVQSAE